MLQLPPDPRRAGPVNYAASLATVVVLAFFFPLLVRLASGFGVSRSLSASTLAVVLTFIAAS